MDQALQFKKIAILKKNKLASREFPGGPAVRT